MQLSAEYRAKDKRISFVDSLAIALAKHHALTLLTGDVKPLDVEVSTAIGNLESIYDEILV